MERESVPECFEEFGRWRTRCDRCDVSHACSIRSQAVGGSVAAAIETDRTESGDDDVGSRLRAAAARGQDCYGKFDEHSVSYHREHCAADIGSYCDRLRTCIDQAGIQNVRIDDMFIAAKPIEAPNCYANYYNQVHRNREIDCEDTCRFFFTDCVKAALSASKFEHESLLNRPTSRVEIERTRDVESEKETQPDEPTSRFDIIDIDEDEDE